MRAVDLPEAASCVLADRVVTGVPFTREPNEEDVGDGAERSEDGSGGNRARDRMWGGDRRRGRRPGSVTAVSAQSSALGTILVSSTGRSLYHDGSEKGGVILCSGACATQWPPLLVAAGAKATAEPGAKASLLGTIKRPDGKVQVTYHGMPLYLYSGDKKAGDVKGQGSGGIWHVISPSGLVITTALKSSRPTDQLETHDWLGYRLRALPRARARAPPRVRELRTGTTGTASGQAPVTGTGSRHRHRGRSGATNPNDCTANPGGYGCM